MDRYPAADGKAWIICGLRSALLLNEGYAVYPDRKHRSLIYYVSKNFVEAEMQIAARWIQNVHNSIEECLIISQGSADAL